MITKWCKGSAVPLKDHLNKIEYFCIVAETGSLRKASEIARIVQPRLTKVIQELEEVLGVILIVRSARGVSLTKEGKSLHKQGRLILKQANEIEHVIRFGDSAPKGVITIGAYDSIARYFMSSFIKFVTVAAPELKINMVTGRSADLIKQVAKNVIDLALVVRPPGRLSHLQMTDICSDQFGLFASPSMGDHFRNTLIYLPLKINDPEASKKKFRFHQTIVCESLETVLALAEQGIGVALLPTLVTKESILAKRLTPFTHPNIRIPLFDSHSIAICQPKDDERPLTSFFAVEMKRFFEHWR